MSVPLFRPLIRRSELDVVLDDLVHEKIYPGSRVQSLCAEFSKYTQCAKSLAFATAKSAAKYVFDALNVSIGESVVLSPLAPSYWVEALNDRGATATLVDVAADCPVLSVDAVRERLSENPRAIVLDTSLGYIPDYRAFRELGVFLIEDASHGLGGFVDLQSVGTVGDVVLFHMAPEHLVTSGNGALVGVRSKKHVQEFFEKQPSNWDYLPDFCAALALSQWHNRENSIARKKDLFRHLFHKLPTGIRPPKQKGDAEVVGPWFPLVAEVGGKEIVSYTQKKGVEARWAYSAQSFLNSDSAVDFCPNARYFLFHTLVFPLSSSMTSKETELLGKVLSTLP